MSVAPLPCTCDAREHGCSPPCPAHPKRGGGLGNPGILYRRCMDCGGRMIPRSGGLITDVCEACGGTRSTFNNLLA